ncbi:late competence development ComFB family protein [Caproicibacter fermentans]|uniref:Late competence development ComFB family protein n=1 Tax=Caproicibacter fermentans TaxID=2576756 RepID=A0A7G8T7T5_9FIRM|nr:late competence development ComFB family protein [Caproicibacter fermentans]QNK39676.1 late competence development ComFB family protein [Caproicibacter fermentans]
MPRSKKEIDKELMYKKLMPSQSKQQNPAEEAGAVNEAAAAPQSDFSAPPQREPAAHREPEPHKVSVPSLDSRRTEVVNVMEEVVLEKLDSVLARFQCCRCDRCKKDIVALALNKLPPKYRVVSDGQITPDLDAQTNAQVVTAMIQAVIRVRAKPRH